jgi:hypothetical protein
MSGIQQIREDTMSEPFIAIANAGLFRQVANQTGVGQDAVAGAMSALAPTGGELVQRADALMEAVPADLPESLKIGKPAEFRVAPANPFPGRISQPPRMSVAEQTGYVEVMSGKLGNALAATCQALGMPDRLGTAMKAAVAGAAAGRGDSRHVPSTGLAAAPELGISAKQWEGLADIASGEREQWAEILQKLLEDLQKMMAEISTNMQASHDITLAGLQGIR